MKFLIAVIFSVFCLFPATADNFKTEYNDVLDSTTVCHKKLEVGYMYNLQNSLSSERENVRIFIYNGKLVFEALFNNRRWAFLDKIVFLNGSRFVFENGKRTDGFYNNNSDIIEERYVIIMDDDQIKKFYDFLKANKKITVSFVGSKYTSDKLKLKEKYVDAMIETIEKYFELQKQQ